MTKKILIIGAHPDDETLGCGGVIAKKINNGDKVVIIIMTKGEKLFSHALGITSNPTPEEVTTLRRNETINSVQILGGKKDDIIFLNYADGSLEKNINSATNKIKELLLKIQPDEIYYQNKYEAHPDHRSVNKIVKNALKKLKLNIPQYQYIVSLKYKLLLKDIAKENKIIRREISKYLHIKEKALKQFKSHLKVISKHQIKPLVVFDRWKKKYLTKYEKFIMEK